MSRIVNAQTAKRWHALNAVVAWSSVLLSLVLNIIGFYAGDINPDAPTLLGNVAGGQDDVWERVFDWLTYFTIWSNIIVAVVMTVLLLKPELFHRNDRVGVIWRALRVDSVVMIVVTGLVYNLLLNEGGKTGIDWLSDFQQHQLNPAITLIVFIIAGPKRLVTWSTVSYAMVLPLCWALFALVRGQTIGAYPYFFLNVAELGLTSVLAFIAQILLFALALCALLLGLDRVTARSQD